RSILQELKTNYNYTGRLTERQRGFCGALKACDERLNRDGVAFGLREKLRKPEGMRRWAMQLVVFEAFAAFGDRRNVAGGNPPKTVVRLFHFLEPFRAVFKDMGVLRAVNVVLQGSQRFPDGH